MRAMIYIILGVVAILLALWMALPVVVNLPDSWFGALLIVLLLAGGGAMVALGIRALRKAKSSHQENNPGGSE